jgi:hypothetical protein
MLLSLFCCMLADWGWEASMRVPSFLVAANVCCNCCGKNPDFGVAGLRAVLLSSSSEFGAVHPLVLHCLGVADVHLLPLLPCFLGSCCFQQLGKERCWLVGWKTLEKKTCRIGLHVHAVHVLPLETIVSMAMNCMAASSILMHLMYSTSMYKKYIYIYIYTAGP